jgi:nifR3 family TIM-barrel protein
MIQDLIKKTKIVVAPMAGISDPPFRKLCRDFGAELCYTEMISSVGIVKGDKKSLSFTFTKDEHPIAAQIFGSDPYAMGAAAQHFQDAGADMIDINFGCPVKKVAKQNAGAELSRDLVLTEKIISAVRSAIQIPLSIKLRLGWNASEENYLEICKIADANGVDVLCLHPRYATQLYSGNSNWSKINEIRKVYSGLIIGSGDIKSTSEINSHLANYDVDAVMIGRALWGNPWLLSDYHCKERLSLQETILLHFKYLSSFHGEKKAATLFRKFVSKYVRGLHNAHELRLIGNKMNNANDIKELVLLIQDSAENAFTEL